MSDITIISVSEETNAWVRKGNAAWRGLIFYYKFSWVEGDGYEIITIDPSENWSAEEIEEFEEWRENHEDFAGYLDDLTCESA